MTPEELAQIKNVIHGTINESTKVATEEVKAAINEHANGADHRLVKMWGAKEKRKTEMWESVKRNVVVYFIVVILGGTGVAIWAYVKKAVSE